MTPPTPPSPNPSLRLYFGGSFDPPHTGHAQMPRLVLEALHTPNAPIIYVPAARSPHKAAQPTSATHRIEMLRIATRGNEQVSVWETEIERSVRNPGEASYWSQTWDEARAAFPDAQNRFLIGADQALSMHRWHAFETIWRDALVVLRDEHDEPERLITSLRSLRVWSEDELDRWLEQIVRVPTIDASSTQIRQALQDPLQRENPIAGLDDRVHSYILEHGLYLY